MVICAKLYMAHFGGMQGGVGSFLVWVEIAILILGLLGAGGPVLC